MPATSVSGQIMPKDIRKHADLKHIIEGDLAVCTDTASMRV